MALVTPATGLPTPAQEPIYKPISPEWEPKDDTGNGIPNLIDIPEEVIFLVYESSWVKTIYSNAAD